MRDMNGTTIYQVRPAQLCDVPEVMAMYDHSRQLMRAMGNTTQWVGYPTQAQLECDMAADAAMIVEANGRPAGTFALVDGEEPTYAKIVHGRWIDDRHPYATIHRVACTGEVRGVTRAAYAYAKRRYPYLRFDTHESNPVMRHVADREGFVYSGVVFMNDGTERLAYEWWRWDEVDVRLRGYIEGAVLPCYDAFDAAHGRDHALRVTARCMMLCEGMGIAPNVAYAAAMMHDVGLRAGRECHHIEGGRMVRSDTRLREWLDAEQIETVAQAVEDHRASAACAPRSPLGCLLAEADRDVEPERIVRRTVEYGLAHYPSLGREEQWQRALQHLNEKYAEGGYLHLWLENSPNLAPLNELRHLIADEERLRTLFDRYYDEKNDC